MYADACRGMCVLRVAYVLSVCSTCDEVVCEGSRVRGESGKKGRTGVCLYAFEAVDVGAGALQRFRCTKIRHRAEQLIAPFVQTIECGRKCGRKLRNSFLRLDTIFNRTMGWLRACDDGKVASVEMKLAMV